MTAVTIKNGGVYIDSATSGKFFAGVENVALLHRRGNTYLMPLRAGAGGGLLLKTLNAKGDKVVYGRDYLNHIGIDPDAEMTVAAKWDADMAGLRLDIPAGR